MKSWGVLWWALLATASADPPPAEQTDLFGLIRTQMEALQREDIPAVTATIHSQSPLREATQSLIEKLKDAYDLRYTVTDLKLESVTDEEARVSFSQLTEKVSGPQFRNNRVFGVHVFKKEDGKWKFYDSRIDKVEYFDKEPEK